MNERGIACTIGSFDVYVDFCDGHRCRCGVGRGHNTGGRRHGDEASAREVARSFLMPLILFVINWLVHLSLLQAMRSSRFGTVANFRTELNSVWPSDNTGQHRPMLYQSKFVDKPC